MAILIGMRTFIFLLIFGSLAVPVVSREKEPEQDTLVNTTMIRRKANSELLTGTQVGSYLRENQYNGEVIPGQSWTHTYLYFGVGFGMHIPLTVVGELNTLWLVPAVSLWASFGEEQIVDEWGTAKSEKVGAFDVSIPIHVTYGYGGLRRKSVAWGIEGGLGVNFGYRSRSTWGENYFTFTPSAIVDITYAPKNVYRIRLMADILPAKLSDQSTYREYYRTFTAQFILGL